MKFGSRKLEVYIFTFIEYIVRNNWPVTDCFIPGIEAWEVIFSVKVWQTDNS